MDGDVGVGRALGWHVEGSHVFVVAGRSRGADF